MDADVVITRHPELGITAALPYAHPVGHRILCAHDFRYLPAVGLYLLPPGTDDSEAVSVAAHATARLEGARLTVDTDPSATRPPAAASPPKPDRTTLGDRQAERLRALTDTVRTMSRSSDLVDALRQVLDDDIGTISTLHQFIRAAAQWCRTLNTGHGDDAAARLRAADEYLSLVSHGLTHAVADLTDMPTDLPPNAVAPAA